MDNERTAREIIREFGVVEFKMWRRKINVSSYSEVLDPEWKFTDAHGHNHWCSTKTGKKIYPTLIWIIDHEDDGEYPEEGHYECAACGEHISPGMLSPSGFTEYIGGQPHYAVKFSDGKEIHMSEEDVQNLYEAEQAKYDYGYKKLRSLLKEIKERGTGKNEQI